VNPLTGVLKYFSTTILNTVVALVFFLVSAHYTSPSFVGNVAIVQLMELITNAFLSLIPLQLVSREISYRIAIKSEVTLLVSSFLTFSLLISPILLIVFLFNNYLVYAVPYLISFFYGAYQYNVLSGLGKFTEANIGSVIFIVIKWGLSIIAVIQNNIVLLIAFWTIGSLLKSIYYQYYLSFRFFIDKRLILNSIKEGLSVYLSGVVSFISSQGERILTAYLLGPLSLGIYQLVALISSVPYSLLTSFNYALLPSSTYYSYKGKTLPEITSLSFRFYVLASLPTAIIALGLSPFFIERFFPEYSSGISSMELLAFSLTASVPFQYLSTSLIVAKKNLRALLLISLISALEVVSLSLILIPSMGIYGGAIAQSINNLITSFMLMFASVKQGLFEMKREEVNSIIVAFISLLSFASWELALIALILAIKLLGIVKKEEVSMLKGLLPDAFKGIARIFNYLAK